MRIVRQLSESVVQKRSRHTEVNQERPTRFEPNNQILATAVDNGHPLTLEFPRDLDRVERARQASVGDLHLDKIAPFEHGHEPAANGLDLGQLGHAAHRTGARLG